MSGILKGAGRFDEDPNARVCVHCEQTFAPWGEAVPPKRHRVVVIGIGPDGGEIRAVDARPTAVPEPYWCLSCRTPGVRDRAAA